MNPGAILTILGSLFIFCAIVAITSFNTKWGRRIKLVSIAVCVVSFGSLVTLLSFTHTLGAITPTTSIAVRHDGTIRGIIPAHTLMLWKSDPRYLTGDRLVPIGDMVSLTQIQAAPVSSNPKVRNYTFEIDFGITDQDRFLQFFGGSGYPCYSYSSWTRSHLFEFNEKNSKEIAQRFYNPEDKDQQLQFSKMVENYLEGHLTGTGLGYNHARFRLP